ncbi:MAG: hypothetical protein H0U26_08715 [Acidimicrobiia bacterium]|nr:hypothetical protein [Acidimicrobiia bacterium]
MAGGVVDRRARPGTGLPPRRAEGELRGAGLRGRGRHRLGDELHLGDRSFIAAGCLVRDQVRIGADCSVNAHATIAGKVEIGDAKHCRFAFATERDGLSFAPQGVHRLAPVDRAATPT